MIKNDPKGSRMYLNGGLKVYLNTYDWTFKKQRFSEIS